MLLLHLSWVCPWAECEGGGGGRRSVAKEGEGEWKGFSKNQKNPLPRMREKGGKGGEGARQQDTYRMTALARALNDGD